MWTAVGLVVYFACLGLYSDIKSRHDMAGRYYIMAQVWLAAVAIIREIR